MPPVPRRACRRRLVHSLVVHLPSVLDSTLDRVLEGLFDRHEVLVQNLHAFLPVGAGQSDDDRFGNLVELL